MPARNAARCAFPTLALAWLAACSHVPVAATSLSPTAPAVAPPAAFAFAEMDVATLQQRMQALRPQIAALCPSIRRLAELQQGVRDGNGRPLNLLQIDP